MSDRPATESKPSTLEEGGAAPASSDERGSFLGFVAHEMRNPLSTALWSAELLARLSPEERAGARGDKLAGMCLRSLQRLRLLVEDHFLAERLQVGGIPLRLESVPVREALDVAVAKASPESVQVDIDEELAVWADRGLLERALEGVIAVAGRNKTALHVSAHRDRDTGRLSVRGAPVEADALQPPHKGTASDPTGRSLSLHMAVQVLGRMGGALTASGEAYEVVLPAAPGARPEPS